MFGNGLQWGMAACALVLLAGDRAEAGVLTPETVVDLKEVRQVVLHPDGDRIAYTLEVPRREDDDPGRSYAELWVANAAGGEPRRFVSGSERVTDPSWSPDGEWIGFVTDRAKDADEDEGRRLYVIPRTGGEARRLFEHDGSVGSYRWSPDGRFIAFVSKDAETDDEKADKKAGKDWKVMDEDDPYHRLWLFDTESLDVRQWFGEDLDVSSFDWTPDGSSVVFQAAKTPRIDVEYMYSRIYRVRLDGEPELVTETIGKLGPMALSPDGTSLAFLGASSLNDPLAQSVFVTPVAGGKARNLTPAYEGTAHDLTWLDARHLLLLGVERERHVMYRVGVEDGERENLSWPGLIVNDLAAATGVSRVAVAAEAPSHPGELFIFEPGRGEPTRLTQSNPVLDDVRLARQEVVHWKGADDWDISGMLTYPLDYEAGKRYPLVLQVHGGPEGVSLDGWTTSAGYPVQLLASRGYMVLQPNYRGSQGRGIVFSKADHDDLGGKEFEDVLAGIDALVERGIVDGERVGTGGWSYGGYMSAWAATRHSERFRASVVAAGLTNWIAFAGTTDIPYEMSLVHWDSWWFDEPELHWERSPLAHVQKARTPTLIVHGEKDDRVHPEQGLEMYTALRIKGVPTQYVVYPREPHGLNERAHRLDFIERVLDWFDTYLAATPAAGS